MVTRGRNRAFRELIGSEDYRGKLRKQLRLGDDQPLPPKLAALARELQEELGRREQQWADETAAALVHSTAPHLFSSSVNVRAEPPGETRSVDTAEAAVEELLDWTERGPKWNLAVRVCIAVIADKMEAEEARKAFLAAAEEEGVLRSSD
ncbi:MAG: DUF982 domain-containing protein [Mesorhizobium sp.]|nr:MAG: DUF982 domain-containing protein [Mesorhizobium sp.]